MDRTVADGWLLEELGMWFPFNINCLPWPFGFLVENKLIEVWRPYLSRLILFSLERSEKGREDS
jgi:hypothetical protein